MHVMYHQQEYGSMHNAMDLIISEYEGSRLNYVENVYIQPSQRKVN